MTSQVIDELTAEAFSLAGKACDSGAHYESVFDDLFSSNIGDDMSRAEQAALYPQFRRAIEPGLLRLLRSWGEIGVVNGGWRKVEGNAVLEKARGNDTLSAEEHALLEEAERFRS